MTTDRQPREVACELFHDVFQPNEDFTLLLSDAYLRDRCVAPPDWWEKYCQERAHVRAATGVTSFAFEESLVDRSDTVSARLQVSRCHKGLGWSVTVRWRGASWATSKPVTSAGAPRSKWEARNEYGFRSKDPKNPPNPFLTSIAEVVDYLYERVRNDVDPPHHGVILVTGTTACGKSQVARGLACKFLQAHTGRKAHLVTCEQPIEEFYWPPPPAKGSPPTYPIDYTPREVIADCASLEESLCDALRQTPTVVFLGELRTETELHAAINFGGTGHLAIATTHAGGLVEAVAKTLDAMKARRAGERAIHVPKLLAVMHLSQFKVSYRFRGQAMSTSALLPTLYRRTPLGLQTLTADGMAALLPYCPQPTGARQYGTLGRRFFLRTRAANGQMHDHGDRPEAADGLELYGAWPSLRSYHFSEHESPLPTNSLVDADATAARLAVRAMEDDLYAH